MKSQRRHPYFAAALIVSLLACIFLAGCHLLASAYQNLVLRTDLLHPSATALTASRLATRLDPGNINYLSFRAYLEESRTGGDAALKVFHSSLAASPVWPHSWATIARHRARYGMYDDRTQYALARSQKLGPNERTVQVTNAILGVTHWYRMTPALRKQIEPSIVFALTHETSQYMHGFMGSQGYSRLYCRRFARAAGGEKWCIKNNLPLSRKGPG